MARILLCTQSPLGEVDHNRRSSRLANATYPKRQVDTDDEEGEGEDAVNDVEELGEEDEEEEEVDDDDEEDEEVGPWAWQRVRRAASQAGGRTTCQRVALLLLTGARAVEEAQGQGSGMAAQQNLYGTLLLGSVPNGRISIKPLY